MGSRPTTATASISPTIIEIRETFPQRQTVINLVPFSTATWITPSRTRTRKCRIIRRRNSPWSKVNNRSRRETFNLDVRSVLRFSLFSRSRSPRGPSCRCGRCRRRCRSSRFARSSSRSATHAALRPSQPRDIQGWKRRTKVRAPTQRRLF